MACRPLATACLALATATACAPAATTARPPSSAAVDAGDADDTTRPVVVFVHADWCAACRRIAPAVAWLREEYAGRITYVDLDVTDAAATERSTRIAAESGLSAFFRANGERTGAVILGRRHKEVRRFVAELRTGPYREAMDEAFSTYFPASQ